MKRPQSHATQLRLAVIDAPPMVIQFPIASRGPQRDYPRGRTTNVAASASTNPALGQLRTRLYRMIVENERGRTHGNRAS